MFSGVLVSSLSLCLVLTALARCSFNTSPILEENLGLDEHIVEAMVPECALEVLKPQTETSGGVSVSLDNISMHTSRKGEGNRKS